MRALMKKIWQGAKTIKVAESMRTKENTAVVWSKRFTNLIIAIWQTKQVVKKLANIKND